MARIKHTPSKKVRTKKKVVKKKVSFKAEGGIKRPKRFRPGTVALREIKRFQ